MFLEYLEKGGIALEEPPRIPKPHFTEDGHLKDVINPYTGKFE